MKSEGESYRGNERDKEREREETHLKVEWHSCENIFLTFPKLPFPNSFKNLNSSRQYFRMGLIGATVCCGRPFISDDLLL